MGVRIGSYASQIFGVKLTFQVPDQHDRYAEPGGANPVTQTHGPCMLDSRDSDNSYAPTLDPLKN